MMKTLFILMIILVLSACSSSKVPYAWQGQTKSYLTKYQEMMLKGDFFQAQYYLDDAIKTAKNDATLETLAVVYLSKCAMNKAMNLKTQCQSYESLKSLLKQRRYDDYEKMLRGQKVDNISNLGHYYALYQAIVNKDVQLSDIKSLETVYAQAIAAIVVDKHGLMNKEISHYMIDKASHENMKGLMLVWLKKSQSFATGEALQRLKREIKILSD